MPQLAILGGQPAQRNPMAPWPVFDQSEKDALMSVLESRVWGGYSVKLTELERAFSGFHESRFGVATANGTVSLEVALLAIGMGTGDEVIVPPTLRDPDPAGSLSRAHKAEGGQSAPCGGHTLCRRLSLPALRKSSIQKTPPSSR